MKKINVSKQVFINGILCTTCGDFDVILHTCRSGVPPAPIKMIASIITKPASRLFLVTPIEPVCPDNATAFGQLTPLPLGRIQNVKKGGPNKKNK